MSHSLIILCCTDYRLRASACARQVTSRPEESWTDLTSSDSLSAAALPLDCAVRLLMLIHLDVFEVVFYSFRLVTLPKATIQSRVGHVVA